MFHWQLLRICSLQLRRLCLAGVGLGTLLRGRVMGQNLYVRRAGKDKVHGPFTVAQVKQLAANGQLTRDDFLSRDGQTEWQSAGAVKGLFPAAELIIPLANPPRSVAPLAPTLPAAPPAIMPSATEAQPPAPVRGRSVRGVFSFVGNMATAASENAKARRLEAEQKKLAASQPPAPISVPGQPGQIVFAPVIQNTVTSTNTNVNVNGAGGAAGRNLAARVALACGTAAIVCGLLPQARAYAIPVGGIGLVAAAVGVAVSLVRWGSGLATSILAIVFSIVGMGFSMAPTPERPAQQRSTFPSSPADATP